MLQCLVALKPTLCFFCFFTLVFVSPFKKRVFFDAILLWLYFLSRVPYPTNILLHLHLILKKREAHRGAKRPLESRHKARRKGVSVRR